VIYQMYPCLRYLVPRFIGGVLVLTCMCLLFFSCSPAQKYEATIESIRAHKVPQWFDDAKFGIFIHWGLYSVPGWAPPIGEPGKVDWDKWFRNNPYAEWYANTMKFEDSPTRQYHHQTYGEKFGYYDFIPIFNEENKKWDPNNWAKFFKQAGARYVVLTTKHHDGFTLWPSRVKNPKVTDCNINSPRDIVGELTSAVRGQGLKIGLYYSGGLDWTIDDTRIDNLKQNLSTPQTKEYIRYVDAHWRELIDRYKPAVLWNDIGYPRNADVLGLFAYYYNNVPDGVINNRWSVSFCDFTTPEYAKYDKITPKKWETCRGIGFSFGYNRNETEEHTLSADAIVDLLIDITSKNGNLLLNVGPTADGTIPELQAERLREVGRWLAINGQAIYGTRPWIKAEASAEPNVPIRFTTKKNTLYAILLDKPSSLRITVKSLVAPKNAKIRMLGTKGNLKWSQQGDDLVVMLPDSPPGDYAWCLEIRPAPKK